MLKFYDQLFCSTFILVEKIESIDANRGYIFEALSTVLSLMVSHFLFIFGLCILLYPGYRNFGLDTLFFTMLFFGVIFWALFIRSGRYRDILEKYYKQSDKSRFIGIVVNSALAGTFFIAATIEIIRVSNQSG